MIQIWITSHGKIHLSWIESMTEETKLEIETLRFPSADLWSNQVLEGSEGLLPWPSLDKCTWTWPLAPLTSKEVLQITMSSGVTVRIKGSEGNCTGILSVGKEVDSIWHEYRDKLKNIHWEEIQSKDNLEDANHWLESQLSEVLQEMCPMRIRAGSARKPS